MSQHAKRSIKALRRQARKNDARATGIATAKVTRGYVRVHRPARGESIGRAITEALDPARAPGAVVTGEELRAKIAAELGVQVAPRRKCEVEGCTEEPGRGWKMCRTHGRERREARKAGR